MINKIEFFNKKKLRNSKILLLLLLSYLNKQIFLKNKNRNKLQSFSILFSLPKQRKCEIKLINY